VVKYHSLVMISVSVTLSKITSFCGGERCENVFIMALYYITNVE